MSHDDEINALRAELAAMEARLDDLAPETTRGPVTRLGTTSALNWTAGATVGNAFTSKLGPHGLTLKANGSATQHYELIVDITAFIT